MPVEYPDVAPDGTRYILHNDRSVGNDFYVVDVRTGARTFALSGNGPAAAPNSWTIVRYASEGVYLWSTGIRTVPGLWLLDPMTGSVRLVDGSHYWGVVGDGAAWAIDPPFGSPADTYGLYRLDLTSGEVRTWYEGRTPIRVLSSTSEGEALVSYGEYGSGKLEVVTAPGLLVPLDVPGDFPQIYEAYMAPPGVWLPLPKNGIALYRHGVGAHVMTHSPDIFSVAGGCQ